MKRRRLLQAAVAVPAAAALAQQATAPASLPAPTSPSAPALNPTQPLAPNVRTPPAAADTPPLQMALPDEAADMVPRFFTPAQFAALRKLSDLILPPLKGAAGALDARAPEFLDFLLGDSPAERQQLYRTGLDALNAQAKKRFGKLFAELAPTDAAALLAPLREPWTYELPADPLARFLRAAKQDIRTATMNSREYVASASSGGGRRTMGGVGLYWHPVD